MSLARGSKTVTDMVKDQGPMGYRDVVSIILNILGSFKGYHSDGNVYGSVMPANISVYPADNYRVELREAIDPILLPDDLTGLSLDDLLGLSPEHFNQNQGLDHRSDLYGLGYIAYYLLTGQANPYGAKTAVDLADKISQGSLPDPSLVRPGIPEWLSKVVQKLTAPEQAQRYQSVFSLIRNLESGLASEPKPAEAPPIHEPLTTAPEAPQTTSETPISDFNPYQPVSRDKPLKSAQGIVIKGLFAGLGVVILVVVALLFFLRGNGNNGQNTSTELIQRENSHNRDSANLNESTDMILVSGARFDMGDISGNGDENEKPVHEVLVSSFMISRYEVSQGEWKRVMGTNPAKFQDDDLPVEQVDWYSAIEFCNKKSLQEGLQPCYSGGNYTMCDWSANGYRLPTEAEWEFAAKGRGESQNFYSGSNDPSEVAWFSGNSGGKTHRIGTKRSNSLGIYDMSGNVCEWCWDIFDASYYSQSPKQNPKGPDSGEYRVTRGGSYSFDEGYFFVSDRNYYRKPSSSSPSIGIRLVRSVK